MHEFRPSRGGEPVGGQGLGADREHLAAHPAGHDSSLRPEQEGERFGPALDFLPPMQVKEIGAAPNSVLWHVGPAYEPPRGRSSP